MIVNPDHMSQAAVDDTLTLARGEPLLRRDLAARLGGPGQLAAALEARRARVPRTPHRDRATSTSTSTYRPRQTPYLLGWGYGADLGGLRRQPDAARGQRRLPVQVLRRQGHLRPPDDRRADLRLHQGGRRPLRALRRLVRGPAQARRSRAHARHGNGAEAYLQMWERASGIRTPSCRPPARPRDRARAAGGSGSARSGRTLLRAPASRSSATAPGPGACAGPAAARRRTWRS